MAVTLASLIVPLTKDDVVATTLKLLKLAGFPVTSWQPSSVPRALIEVFAQSLADLSTTVSNIARSGFLSLAEGEWLTLLADELFDVQRKPAVFTEGVATLTDGGGGPFTILPGQIWAVSKGGRRFSNTTGGIVPLGGTLTLSWKAESSGASYNVASGDLSTLVTPLPGVTINNPPLPTGTWITAQGVDEESDPAVRVRCQEKWSSLGAGGNAPAYAFHAKNASPQVTRVRVYEATPKGGEVTVVVAGPAGALVDPTIVMNVAAYLEDGRRPQCVTVHVASATNRVIPLIGEVRVRATMLDPAKAFVSGQVTDLQQSLDIGEKVPVSELIERVMDAPGVVNVGLVSTAGIRLVPEVDDFVLGPTEVAAFTNGLTWISL